MSVLLFVDSKKGTISDWLRSIGLGQYEHVLVVNGFDNINLLVSIDSSGYVVYVIMFILF